MASFDFVTGWGAVFGFSNVGFTLDATSTALSAAYSGSFVVRPGSSSDQIVLGDWTSGTDGAVLGWTPSGGTHVLAQGPWLPSNVAASAKHIAWLGVHGERAMDGYYDQAEIYWSPRAFDASGISTQVLPGVPMPGLPFGFFTGGDFVSLGDCWNGCRILVADLRTKKLWAIPAANGHAMHVIGMTESEVLAGEQRDQSEPMFFQTLYRYDVTRLAEYAAVL
jgi:hypothetical protein